MMNKALYVTTHNNNIATLTLNIPDKEMNILSSSLVEELVKAVTALQENTALKALIIKSGKPIGFCDALDIDEMMEISYSDNLEENILAKQEIVKALRGFHCPTIALVNGKCYGEGLELVLACSHRIATTALSTSFGFPALAFGVPPYLGGIHLLSSIISLDDTLSLITSSQCVDVQEALRMSLVDGVISEEEYASQTEEEVYRYALAQKERSSSSKSRYSFFSEKNIIYRSFRIMMLRRALKAENLENFYALKHSMKLLGEAYFLEEEENFQYAASLGSLIFSYEETKNLIASHLLEKHLSPSSSSHEAPFSLINICDKEEIGGYLCWKLGEKGYMTRLKGFSWAAIANMYHKGYEYYFHDGGSPSSDPQFVHTTTTTLDYSGFGKASLVFENTGEDLERKRQSLREIENKVSSGVPIVSHSHLLLASQREEAIEDPSRFVAVHFSMPIDMTSLVEVIPGDHTSMEVLRDTLMLLRHVGKTPLVVKDTPGFLLHRLLIPFLCEAMMLLEEGIEIQRIDNNFKKFGMKCGPFALIDDIGLDIIYKTMLLLNETIGGRIKIPYAAKVLYEKGFLGKKVQKGFYRYDSEEPKENKEIYSTLSLLRRQNSLIGDTSMVRRVLHLLINEASWCLEEKLVTDPAVIDLALIKGMGFPAAKGGLLRYADSLGTVHVVSKLKQLLLEYGKRFAPSPYLNDLKDKKNNFYHND
jgi:3-hydroxyacyl-CoA dehydrogenase / enoyl-CoA hydratase / 3-hydroxybutyryl-CoA epimerase